MICTFSHTIYQVYSIHPDHVFMEVVKTVQFSSQPSRSAFCKETAVWPAWALKFSLLTARSALRSQSTISRSHFHLPPTLRCVMFPQKPYPQHPCFMSQCKEHRLKISYGIPMKVSWHFQLIGCLVVFSLTFGSGQLNQGNKAVEKLCEQTAFGDWLVSSANLTVLRRAVNFCKVRLAFLQVSVLMVALCPWRK